MCFFSWLTWLCKRMQVLLSKKPLTQPQCHPKSPSGKQDTFLKNLNLQKIKCFNILSFLLLLLLNYFRLSYLISFTKANWQSTVIVLQPVPYAPCSCLQGSLEAGRSQADGGTDPHSHLPPFPNAAQPPDGCKSAAEPLAEGCREWLIAGRSSNSATERVHKLSEMPNPDQIKRLNSCLALHFCSTTLSTHPTLKSARNSGNFNTNKAPIRLSKKKKIWWTKCN